MKTIMKTLVTTATALSMGGAAMAYQTQNGNMDAGAETTQQQHGTHTSTQMAMDPTAAMMPPANWSSEQRNMYQQHMANLPANWTEQQRTAFEDQLRHPPAHWTAEQRNMYQQHMANLPANWTAQQRSMYQQQTANLQSPWNAGQQTAAMSGGTHQDDHSMHQQGQMQSGPVPTEHAQNSQTQTNPTQSVEMQNGMQQQTASQDQTTEQWAGMGGPYEEVYGNGEVSLQPRPATTNYPPCSQGAGDDRCIQLYERGVRASVSSWNGDTGGSAQ